MNILLLSFRYITTRREEGRLGVTECFKGSTECRDKVGNVEKERDGVGWRHSR